MTKSNKIAAKRIAIAVAAVCASLAMPAVAADNKAMLDLMLKKGVITQKDYNDFLEANKDAEENQAFKNQRLDQDVTKSVKFMQKRDKDGAVSASGFGLTSEDGNNSINLTGRMHFDSRIIESAIPAMADRDSSSLADNFEMRRARIGINGKLFKDLGYELVTNAVGSNANLIDTAWLNYGFNKDAQIRVGRFKQPFSLEELTSSNSIDFMERSYGNQLIAGKKLGAMMHGEPVKGVNYGVSVFQDGFNELTNENNFGPNAAGRVALNLAELQNITDTVLHIGAAYSAGKSQTIPALSSNTQKAVSVDETRATVFGFRSENRGLSNIYRAQISGDKLPASASFGNLSNNAATIDKNQAGLELALARGPVKFQLEYMDHKLNATHKSYDYTSTEQGTALTSSFVDGRAKTLYYEVMYNITGESWADAYKGGVFGGIKPKQNFGSSGWGALQTGIRVSSYDASDTTTSGSSGGTNKSRVQNSDKANTVTVGLNWYLNPNARIMLNYSLTKFDTPVSALDTVNSGVAPKSPETDFERVLSIRTQFNF
jgi:phosphate-selective porin OprO/OprP